MALIGAASEFSGPGFLLPTRNHEVLSWCLAGGLWLMKQMTPMTVGLYNEPSGAICHPSFLDLLCCASAAAQYGESGWRAVPQRQRHGHHPPAEAPAAALRPLVGNCPLFFGTRTLTR
jgi:hypothetical protein